MVYIDLKLPLFLLNRFYTLSDISIDNGYMCMPFVVKQIVYNSEGTPESLEAQLCYQNVISMLKYVISMLSLCYQYVISM